MLSAHEHRIDRDSVFLLIEDHPLFCEAMTLTLTESLGVQHVHSRASLAEALDFIATTGRVDVIVLDLNLPDVSGMDGLIRLKSARPGTPVVVVSSLTETRIIDAVLRHGAAGFISKDSNRDMIVSAFHTIWEGGVHTPEGYTPPQSGVEQAQPDVDRLSDLTPQQARILDAICAGQLNKQIAYDFSIAEATVKAHVTAIMRKLGVQSRTQAVLVAQKAKFASILRDEP